MTINQGEIEVLQKLITESRSFEKIEKEQLIEKLPQLNDEEIRQAIEVFNGEKEKWKAVDEQDKKDLKLFQQFSETSKNNLKKTSKELIKKTEESEEKEDIIGAEELLKSL